MRTEHDLTQALTALEQYAPDPDQVLRAVRPGPRRAGGLRRIGGPRRAGRPRTRRLILPAAAAAAAGLGLAVALLPGSGSPHPAPSALPAAASVAKAMLTAFDSVSGDIEYETQTGINHGATVDVYRGWVWPAQPAPGQRTILRTLYSQATPPSSVVRPIEDDVIEDFAPPGNAGNAHSQITLVCFRGAAQGGCGFGGKDTPPGTWSRFTGQPGFAGDVGPGGLFNPAKLAQGIASGTWRVVGHTILDGQPAIQLSGTGDVIEPRPATLWVNAQTYLPIRLVAGTADTGMTVMNFSFLPPTAANLALLQVPIPPGYPQSAPKR